MKFPYKAVVFDWDGTLVDSADWVVKAHNHVRSTLGYPLWTKEDIFSSSSFSARELYPKIYGERAKEALSLLFDYVDKHNLDSSTPYENAPELLSFLANQEILMGVVSNKRHEPLSEMVTHLQWDSYFFGIVGAGKAARDKPSGDPLLLLLEEGGSNLLPSEILYVGDTETDLLLAKNVGCDVVFIQSDEPRPDLIETYAPVFSCHNLIEFVEWLNNAVLGANKTC